MNLGYTTQNNKSIGFRTMEAIGLYVAMKQKESSE